MWAQEELSAAAQDALSILVGKGDKPLVKPRSRSKLSPQEKFELELELASLLADVAGGNLMVP